MSYVNAKNGIIFYDEIERDKDWEYEIESGDLDNFVEKILIEEYKLDKNIHAKLIDDLKYNDQFQEETLDEYEDEAIEYFYDDARDQANTPSDLEVYGYHNYD